MVNSQGKSDLIAGQSGSLTVNASGSSAAIFSGVDSVGSLVADDSGKGNIYEQFGSGNASLTTSGSGAILFAEGTGTLTVSDTSTQGDTLVGGTGPSFITISGSAAEFFGNKGALTLVASATGGTYFLGTGTSQITTGGGTSSTMVGGSAGTTVHAGAGSSVLGYFNTAGDLSFVGGTGSATIFGGLSGINDTLGGGTGGMVFSGSNGGNASVAGGGLTTIFGGAGGAVTYSGAGNLDYIATGLGNETLDASGSTGSNSLSAQFEDGTASMVGGSGNDTLTAGPGNDTLAGGAGSNIFIYDHPSMFGLTLSQTVSDFSATDTAFLTNYDTASGGTAGSDVAATKALASAVSSGGNTTITVADGTTITFVGVASASTLTGHLFST